MIAAAAAFLNVLLLLGTTRNRNTAVLIDVENVRGKSGFALTHAAVLASLATWSRVNELQGQVTLVIDHGHEPTSHWIVDKDYAIVFSGPHVKADDVLANEAVPYFLERCRCDHIAVVTADANLIKRCQRAHDNVQIIPPQLLLEDLESLMPTTKLTDTTTAASVAVKSNNNPKSLLSLACQLLQVESELRRRRHSNKHRKVLQRRIQSLRETTRLAGSDYLKQVTLFLKQGAAANNKNALAGLPTNDQHWLMETWTKCQLVRHKETTNDRIHLAEELRLQLLTNEQDGTMHAHNFAATSASATPLPIALSYVAWRSQLTTSHNNILESSAATNLLVGRDTETLANKDQTKLRLVVISGTHGYESQLGEALPQGDVLLHLGDFSKASNNSFSIERFDAWLAQQPHPTKIVLRGSHDPRKQLHFALSGAKYIRRPTNVMIGQFSVAFIPHVKVLTNRCLPKTCDVLVSYVPPLGILDRCSNGKLAGSPTLLRGLERMTGGPPTLVVCAHIHKGRGALRTVFCHEQETLVVNAAVSPDVATCYKHGSVMVDIVHKGGRQKNASLVEMKGKYEYLNQQQQENFFSNKHHPTGGKTLLAVDLGLATGVAVFDSTGKLLLYNDFVFKSTADLRQVVHDLLVEWERNLAVEITHVAIEGLDPSLWDAWISVLGSREVLDVLPETWRQDLLLHRERASGELAKAASRIIAKQIVHDYGMMTSHQGDFQTDAAEAVLLGLHVSRRLGWVDREPAIRRQANGSVL
jgi:hypothetical protein